MFFHQVLSPFLIPIFFFFKAAFNNFLPFFLSHPLFHEIPPAANLAIEDFRAKNPDVELPPLSPKVAGLVARIKDSLASTPSKKGNPFFFFFFLSYCFP